MSQEADIDEQLRKDLDKAIALSLEQKEYDDYQRAKKYGTLPLDYYGGGGCTQPNEAQVRPYSDHQQATTTISSVVQRPQGYRRHSEVAHQRGIVAEVIAARERSTTPPPLTTGQNESDLISFASPAATKPSDNPSLDKLLADLPKLQSAENYTALVPLGPSAATAGMPGYIGVPYRPEYQYAGSAAAGSAASVPGEMKLVPFLPPAQRAPLTNEELQRLYQQPTLAAVGPVPYHYPHHMGFVVPPGITLPVAGQFVYAHGAVGYPVTPPISTPGSAAHMQPRYPSSYGSQYAPVPSAAAATTQHYPVNPAGLTTKPPVLYAIPKKNATEVPPLATQSVHGAYSITSADGSMANGGGQENSISGNGGPSTSGRRAVAAPRKSRTEDNLIDLKQEDDSRVSVLEAFDPLLNHDEDSDSGSDGASLYYAEYDRFDYLYSGGGTQYSDPVYDAVNRPDKSPINSNVFANDWVKDFHPPPVDSSRADHEPSTSDSSGRRPPPLPPRNSSESTRCELPATQPQRYEHAYIDRRNTPTRLYEKVSDKRTVDSELLEFYNMVKDLRARYPFDDELTNVGHIIAYEFNYYYPPETSIKVVVHPLLKALYPNAETSLGTPGNIKGYAAPVVFTCDITTPVDLVIGQAFCSLEGQIRGTVNDYAVKPIGVSEWLSPGSKLSQLECVHNSLKLERDVQLGLCLKTNENMRVIARTQRDDENDAALRPEDILPNEVAATITYDNMMILLETLETEIDKLESTAAEPNARAFPLSCSGVVQGVKAICALLGSIDTLELAKCVARLKDICDNSHSGGALSSSHQQGTPEVVNETGDYAQIILRPRSSVERIKLECNNLRDAVQELIELYSNLFRVDFSVNTIPRSTTPIEISNVLKPIMVSINCLHRPPPDWKFDDFSLGVQIIYGTRPISDAVPTKCSNDTSGGLFPRLNISRWISFEKNPICTLPREARLIFVLYGAHTADNEPTSGNDGSGERQPLYTELGWCAMQLFDYKREMVCGSYLLSIWPPTEDKFLGPAPARGCHPKPITCPVLSVEIPTYGGPVVFNKPFESPQPAPRYDINSLDPNLRQELVDTADQGYSGASDKREVLWEKRLYLQNYPRALGKVLHAAHSWDYASLIDLHSLLYSWTPLSPLQALELLLPRYPDAEVRQKAVEWISNLPNDQLVDYLPQLLQALKHDTYEASAMARFLLCKSLESPRIAHHMYWLLVHSLPGDDPQNSIDDTSTPTESMAQARYYRRNQLMLRGLMAVCGEKLMARFVRQNMMCKKLAKTAESVKEAKESLRQKALCYGMDMVHQELVDKPTTLPLGPELEVTGVNVRNCSYFNSNTLPLKVSYIGPDAELLPAIFKSGDDLQQDMLTIQLIRVMNKMWLADGLDLKIVTFNCVPTGAKKGMIEMVTDAETLRKIQGEYGLIGSFKDRPIAEWLARQNPSQLEYQRAVRNFTVSTAGYCVATYILGICDRHNDNIMLKTSGHLFHIDFGKFLGDAQMFGNIKRDRTPFVLTPDMVYVINGGIKPSQDFHFFVDFCCRAFNIIRKHGDLILHMLALMATAGIPGVTPNAVKYVRGALLPSHSNPEAAAAFSHMIQLSLNNKTTQINFFIHALAQMRFSNDEDSGELLSFVPRKYTMQQDGRLKSVQVVRYQKHYNTEKYYMYILRVTRHHQSDPTYLFRSYKEFAEFHLKLCQHSPLAKLDSVENDRYVGRSNIRSVAEKRLHVIQRFLRSLFNSADEIAHSDLVYTFFHPLLRDQQEANLDVSKVKEPKQITRAEPNEDGQLKVSLQYRRGALTVMIHHAKGLPMLQGNQEPSAYVKCYLKPDPTKITKRKTKVVRKSCVPTFMETLEYRMPLEHIHNRMLHVTVWSHDSLQENELLGGFQIDLSQYDLRIELIDWFRLGAMRRH